MIVMSDKIPLEGGAGGGIAVGCAVKAGRRLSGGISLHQAGLCHATAGGKVVIVCECSSGSC